MCAKCCLDHDMPLNVERDEAAENCSAAINQSTLTKVLSVCICVMEILTRDSFWGPAGATDRSEEMGRGGGGWLGRLRGRGWL